MTTSDNECLTDDMVARFVGGQLTALERATADAHIAECDECRLLVADAARAAYDDLPSIGDAADTSAETHASISAGEMPPPELLAPGVRVDRYVVGELIGVGGMGVVYRAHDPQLNRPVTLKLLRRDRSAGQGAQAQLLREAQAMAQLSHSSVVSVYDVGAYKSDVFVAMEYVEGQTLRGWLAQHPTPRQWQLLRPIFLDAGSALSAAHAVGIVHRDFKPDNVLVGADGRARVMDFGLAVPMQSGDILSGEDIVDDDNLSGFCDWDLAMTLTHAGAVKGTPAYMAPEQFSGRAADARADQFGFCVTLYEALYGQRPYHAADIRQFASRRPRWNIALPAETSGALPQAAHAALLRGLSLRPDDRFATMDELLRALDSARTHRNAPSARDGSRTRRWVRPVVALATMLLLASAGWTLYRSRFPAAPAYEASPRTDSGVTVSDAMPPAVADTTAAAMTAPTPRRAERPAAGHRKAKQRRRRTRHPRRKRPRPYDDAPMVPSFAR